MKLTALFALVVLAHAGCSLDSKPDRDAGREDSAVPTWMPDRSNIGERDGGTDASSGDAATANTARDAATPSDPEPAAGSDASVSMTPTPAMTTPPPSAADAGTPSSASSSAGAGGEAPASSGSSGASGSDGSAGAGGMPGLVDSVEDALGEDADPDDVDKWRDDADDSGELDPSVVVPAFNALVRTAICRRDPRSCVAACLAIAVDCSRCAKDDTCRELVQSVCGPLASGCDAP